MFCHFYGELWKLQGKEGEVIGKEDYVIKTPMKNVMMSKKNSMMPTGNDDAASSQLENLTLGSTNLT